MTPYNAVDAVGRMTRSLASEEGTPARRVIRPLLIVLVVLVELAAVWGAVAALTSLI